MAKMKCGHWDDQINCADASELDCGVCWEESWKERAPRMEDGEAPKGMAQIHDAGRQRIEAEDVRRAFLLAMMDVRAQSLSGGHRREWREEALPMLRQAWTHTDPEWWIRLRWWKDILRQAKAEIEA